MSNNFLFEKNYDYVFTFVDEARLRLFGLVFRVSLDDSECAVEFHVIGARGFVPHPRRGRRRRLPHANNLKIASAQLKIATDR